MSSYKKFDPTIIRTRIKEGAYPTLAGANRAIGKTQGLSEEDKAGLKKLAAKHFGGEAPAPVAKKAGKKASKKTATAKAPKAAKKASKKASKKKGTKRAAKAAPAPATEAEPAPVSAEALTETLAPAVAVRRRRGRVPAVKAHASKQLELDLGTKPSDSKHTPDQNTPGAKATLMGAVIGSCDQMLRSITLADNLIPKDVATVGSTVVAQAMTRAVQVLDQEVISPLLKSETTAPPAKVKKTPPSKPKNPTTAVVAVETATEKDDEDDSLPLDALSSEDEDEDDAPILTEEERLGVEALRETMPGNAGAGMRVPNTAPGAR